jgi:hypothetical protein
MTTIGTTSRPAYVYDAQTDTWIPVGVGPHSHDNYVDKVLIDAKGDLIVGTGADAIGKLTVGVEGTFLKADPLSPTGVSWGEVDSGSITVSQTSPSEPEEGDLWFNSTNVTTYIYYDGFWVELSESKMGPTGLPGVLIQSDQPIENNVLWLDTDEESLAPVPAGGTAGEILAKVSSDNYDTAWINMPSGNAIINGAFEVWQRGTSFTPASTSEVYTADRFYAQRDGTGATVTVSRQSFTPGTAPVTGYESEFFLRYAQTVAGTGGTFNQLVQKIEDVRSFAGQTVTFSFWAKAATPTTIQQFTVQQFGTSGSSEVLSPGTVHNINTSWTRYRSTFTIPSVLGKTIGANSRTAMAMVFPNNAVQTIDIWGVQLEAGSVATPFRRNANSIQGELAACQRYYQRFTTSAVSSSITPFGIATSTTAVHFIINAITEMRVAPTSIDFSANIRMFDTVSTAPTMTALSLAHAAGPQTLGFTGTVSSGLTQFRSYRIIAADGQQGFVGFSAEL